MTASNSRMALGVGSVFSAVAALMAGCGEEFTDCAASRTCAPSTGGNAGEAGAPETSGGKGGKSGAGGGGRTSGGSSGTGGKAQAGEGGESGAAEGGRGGGAPVPTDAGAAGEAGAAGAGGDGPSLPTTCERDTDCNDKNACNGVETCEAGECVVGTPLVCTSEDPGNCAAKCETVNGAAVCGHEGLDADEDGFKSAACTLNPGDDCNDADDSIHPGAAEMCDGVDSDCDKQVDADEDEVQVTGNQTILVARDEPEQDILSASIAGYGEKAAGHSGAPFAVAWTYRVDRCVSWQTNLISREGALSLVRASDSCSSSRYAPIDVIARPEVLTLTTRTQELTPRTAFYDLYDANGGYETAQSTGPNVSSLTGQERSLSYSASEYRLLMFTGLPTSNRVRRLGYSEALEQTVDEVVDPEGAHLAVDAANGSAAWTLRKSPTLDQVYMNINGSSVAVSDGSISASHPLLAWSEDNSFALAWRYADGRMRFKHTTSGCEVNVGDGFPGDLAATLKGYVLISLSEDKRSVVATLISPTCKVGPRAAIARVEDGDDDELSEPKIAVTGGYLRALWKRGTGDDTALESKQFRWDQCE